MRLPANEDSRHSQDENVAELLPVFVVMINDDRDMRIFFDVAYALELRRGRALGFFIDRRVKALPVENKADRDHMRLAAGIGCGEMGDPGGAE